MSPKSSEFISVRELIKRPERRLSPEHFVLRDFHNAARDEWKKFLATKKGRAKSVHNIGGQIEATITGKPPTISDEELAANEAGIMALGELLAHYADHGRAIGAYDELREVAKRHWHPIIAESWQRNFSDAAKYMNIKLPAKLKRRIKLEQKAFESDHKDSIDLFLAAFYRRKSRSPA